MHSGTTVAVRRSVRPTTHGNRTDPWLLGVTARDIAAIVEECRPRPGASRNRQRRDPRSDVFSVRRTIFDLFRLGLDVATIREVVYENPSDVLGSNYGPEDE